MKTKLFGLVMFLAACGGGGDGGGGGITPPPSPILTTVNVSLAPANVLVGQTSIASATGVDQNGAPIATGAVTWGSSASSVATINASGAITAVGAGQTTISATAGGKIGQATLTVTLPPPQLTTLQVSIAPTSIRAGETALAAAAGKDQYGNNMVLSGLTWLSSNVTIATVSQSGVITGVSAGPVTITAKVGEITAQGIVNVTGGWTPTNSGGFVATSLASNTNLTNRFGQSAPIYLDIICSTASKLFIVSVSVPHIITRNGIVAYSGTAIPTTSATWLETSSFHGLVHPGPNSASKALANQIALGTDFVIAFGEFNGVTHATTFKVAGMTAAMIPVYDACPGANIATPQQAAALVRQLAAAQGREFDDRDGEARRKMGPSGDTSSPLAALRVIRK